MRKIAIVTFVLPFLAFICQAGVQAKSAATPPGSFVRHRVVSVAQLSQHVRKDAVVLRRYAKHFGIPAGEVADYFAKNLKLVSLKKPLRATVWYVDKRGLIHTKTKLLPKGTAVFVDKTGKPVLAWSCGNPLVKKLAKPVAEKEDVKAAPLETTGVEPVEEVLSPPPGIESPTTLEELVKAAPIETVGVPPIAILPEMTPAIPISLVEQLPTIVFGGGTSPFLGAALVITGSVPVIGSITGGGGTRKGGGGETLVPEPATMLGFGLPMLMTGMRSLGILRKRRFPIKR